jgi:tetratricopeptide (TPR) repeat protein
LALVALTTLPYLNALNNPLIWIDDLEILHGQMIIETWHDLWNILFQNDDNYSGYHRPIYNVMHSFDWWLWRTNPIGFHLSSLVLHIANVILTFGIVRVLSGRTSLAFATSALWALLPVNTATVSLIHSKADLLVTFFLLSSLFSLLHRENTTSKFLRKVLLAITCISYYFALLSKESAFVFPVFTFLFFFIHQSSKPSIHSVKARLIPQALLLTICCSVLLQRVLIRAVNEFAGSWAFIDRILTFIPVYSKYILISLSSLELTTNDSVKVWNLDPLFYTYAIPTAALIAIQLYLFKRYHSSRLSILWFNLFLLPVAQLFPTLHFRADRFLYLPSIGFVCLVVFLASQYCHKIFSTPATAKRTLCIAFFSLLILFGFRIVDRNRDFSSNLALFEPLVEKHPYCREAQAFLAAEYLSTNQFKKSKDAFNFAMSTDPSIASYVDARAALSNYGVLLFKTGEFKPALNVFRNLMFKSNRPSGMTFRVSNTLFHLERYRESKIVLDRYLEAMPPNNETLLLQGKLEFLLGDLTTARITLITYLKSYPNIANHGPVTRLVRNIEKEIAKKAEDGSG